MSPAERAAHDSALMSSPSWWRRQAEELAETAARIRANGHDASDIERAARNAQAEARP